MRRATCAAPKAKLTNLVESKVSPQREAGRPDICSNLSERWIRREAGKPEICTTCLRSCSEEKPVNRNHFIASATHSLSELRGTCLSHTGDPALISPNEQPKNNYTFTVRSQSKSTCSTVDIVPQTPFPNSGPKTCVTKPYRRGGTHLHIQHGNTRANCCHPRGTQE